METGSTGGLQEEGAYWETGSRSPRHSQPLQWATGSLHYTRLVLRVVAVLDSFFFFLGCDAMCNRGQIHISIELHVVKSLQAVIFILYCVRKNLLLDRFLRRKTPVDAHAHRFLTTCSTTVLFMPSSSNSSRCFSRTKRCVPKLFNRADKDDLLIMSTLHAYWAEITADIVPNFTLIAHACSACCGKIHFKRMGLL